MSEKYVIVDKGICIACGSCQCWSPDVFAYDKYSLAYNRLDNNTGTVPIPEAILEDVLPTGVCCPTSAIKIGDEPFNNFVPTPEFGTESPVNPNITYDLTTDEMTINELNDVKAEFKESTTGEWKDGGVSKVVQVGGCCSSDGGCGCGGNCTCGTKPNEYFEEECGCDEDPCICGLNKP